MENETIGKYTLVSKIADGGMAEVFLAQTGGVGGFAKRVALKKILPYFTSDQSFVHSFINEARICGQLHHINLVEVFGFDRSDDVYYLAMEYIDGLDLERILAHRRSRREPFPIAVACALTLQVLDGLHYAHKAKGLDGKPLNVIHRDLKPSNILIDRSGVIKIVDFGIAKASSNVYKTRDLGTAKGTVGYMSPEQAVGAGDLAPSSDLFSVGIILYELLTLRRLFEGKNVFAILEAVRTADVDVQLDELSALPEGLRKVLKKALAREQADRYQGAQEMIRDLRGVSPAGRGHDLLSRFVRQATDQGLTPLHGDAPQTDATKAGGAMDLRTKLLNLSDPADDMGPSPQADEATLPLPQKVDLSALNATQAIPLASAQPKPAAKKPAAKKPAAIKPAVVETQKVGPDRGDTTSIPDGFDPADTWVPPRPAAEPTQWPGGVRPGALLEPTGESLPPMSSRANLMTEVSDLPENTDDLFGGSDSSSLYGEQDTDDLPVARGEHTSDTSDTDPGEPAPKTEAPKARAPRPSPPPPKAAAAGGTLRGKLLLIVVTAIAIGVVGFLYSRFAERPGIYLRIESIPADAEVFMGGQRVLSSTPGTFFLSVTEPSEISLTIKKEGYKTILDHAANLKPDDGTVTFTFPLEKESGVGILSVDSIPAGAAIWVDGAKTGEYTPKDLEVSAGPHSVVLKRHGYRDLTLEVSVPEGKVESVAKSLEAR